MSSAGRLREASGAELLRRVNAWRWQACLPWVAGRLLDVGCGRNDLARHYRLAGGDGLGTDFTAWAGVDTVADAPALPFRSSTFGTVALLACLNHIVEREACLAECRRVLVPHGRLLVTMIDPLVGVLIHRAIGHADEAQHRHVVRGERPGLWPREVQTLLAEAGFQLRRRVRFELGLNVIYVASASNSSSA
ncbi:MAG: class I SAM-dependent methyltransferase [Chloroflexota bacterium]